MKNKKSLLPCPFCGSSAKIYGYDGAYYVSCTSKTCFCSLGEMYDRDAMPCHIFADEKIAEYSWNNRTPIAQQSLSGIERLADEQEDIPKEIAKIIDENFMELL